MLVMLLLADSATVVRRRAKDLVQTNIGVLHKVADVLLEKEQIDGDEFQVRSSCTLQAEIYYRQHTSLSILGSGPTAQPVVPCPCHI
jgi:hypothetical protein